jgi:hypothetical protein
MAMTHADIASTHAVERYLLGELAAEERDDFEAHAFDCLACAEDLKDAAIFLDTCRSLLRDGHPLAAVKRVPATPRRGWRAWLDLSPKFQSYVLAPTMLMLLGFALYQNVVTIPALRNASAPRALSAFSFVSSGTRGATPMVIAAPPQQPFLLFFDIPPGGRFASYRCTIEARAIEAEPPLVVDVSASQARDTVQLFVPAGRLRPGPHELAITGRNLEPGAPSLQPGARPEGVGADKAEQVIARYPFVLQGRP